MREYIRYEKLSSEIKDAISIHYDQLKKNNNDIDFDDAVSDWFENNFDGWILERFQKDSRGDLRKHYRLDVEVPIRVVETLIESSSEETPAIDFVGTIVNISRGGLYFISVQPFEVSSIIRLVIDLSAIDSELSSVEALAMVVRVDKSGEGYGIGVMFSSIYDENKKNLNIFILKNLSYYLYSEQ
ncbi:MAG: PilZ domain-containing protein [Spirochaetota bacterium]